jgi:hypothetical protein
MDITQYLHMCCNTILMIILYYYTIMVMGYCNDTGSAIGEALVSDDNINDMNNKVIQSRMMYHQAMKHWLDQDSMRTEDHFHHPSLFAYEMTHYRCYHYCHCRFY